MTKKKIKTLLFPFLVWCTIYAVSYIPFKLYGNYLAGRDLTYALPMLDHPILSGWNIFNIYGLSLKTYPGCPIIWFVRNLFLLFLFSPLFLFLFRKRFVAILFLSVVFLLNVFETAIPFWNINRVFTLRGLFFFPLGIFFSCYPVSHDSFPLIRRALPFLWVLSSVVTSICLSLDILEMPYSSFLSFLHTLLGIGAIWVLPDQIPSLLRIESWKFSRDTFFLYMFHYLVLAFIFPNTLEKILLNKMHIPILLVYFLRAVCSTVFSLIVAAFLKKHFAKLYRFLIGGR